MKKSDLQQKLDAHRAYSKVLQEHLVRLWERSLSEEEKNVVQSSTLCLSYMGLEASDRALSFATSSQQATEEYESLKAEVDRNSDAVVAEVQRRLFMLPAARQHSAYANLLAWEEGLLAQMP